MKSEELRQLSSGDLTGKIRGWQEELFRTQVKARTSELKDNSVFQKMRSNIARAKTILAQKQNKTPQDQIQAQGAKQ